jgi:hypothetical protein
LSHTASLFSEYSLPVAIPNERPKERQSSLWRGFKIVAISIATTVLPTAALLAIAAAAYFLFPALTFAIIGYAAGWFIGTVAMKIEMYYDLRLLVFLRESVDWLESKIPFFHAIVFVVTAIAAAFFSWPGLFFTLIPGVLSAASCDTHYFRALQGKDRWQAENVVKSDSNLYPL